MTASVDTTAVPALGALLALVTFSSGFLSGRLHTAYREAVAATRRLDAELIELRQSPKKHPKGPKRFPGAQVQFQYDDIKNALQTQLARPMLVLLVVVTSLGVALMWLVADRSHLGLHSVVTLKSVRFVELGLLELGLLAVTGLTAHDYRSLTKRLKLMREISIALKLLELERWTWAAAAQKMGVLRLVDAAARSEEAVAGREEVVAMAKELVAAQEDVVAAIQDLRDSIGEQERERRERDKERREAYEKRKREHVSKLRELGGSTFWYLVFGRVRSLRRGVLGHVARSWRGATRARVLAIVMDRRLPPPQRADLKKARKELKNARKALKDAERELNKSQRDLQDRRRRAQRTVADLDKTGPGRLEELRNRMGALSSRDPGIENWSRFVGLRAIIELIDAFKPEFGSFEPEYGPTWRLADQSWLARAAADLDRATEDDPADYRWWWARALVAEWADDIDTAASCFLRGLRLSDLPNSRTRGAGAPSTASASELVIGQPIDFVPRSATTYRRAYELLRRTEPGQNIDAAFLVDIILQRMCEEAMLPRWTNEENNRLQSLVTDLRRGELRASEFAQIMPIARDAVGAILDEATWEWEAEDAKYFLDLYRATIRRYAPPAGELLLEELDKLERQVVEPKLREINEKEKHELEELASTTKRHRERRELLRRELLRAKLCRTSRERTASKQE